MLLTCDLDFGAILAASGSTISSVVQIRSRDVLPEAIGQVVVSVLQGFEAELVIGALVAADVERSRVRMLPLPRDLSHT